jgi:hypothetical protein
VEAVRHLEQLLLLLTVISQQRGGHGRVPWFQSTLNRYRRRIGSTTFSKGANRDSFPTVQVFQHGLGDRRLLPFILTSTTNP